jgi:hypothetical protein
MKDKGKTLAERYIETCVSLAKVTQDEEIKLNWYEHLVHDGGDGWTIIGSKDRPNPMHEVKPIDDDDHGFWTKDGGLNIEWAQGLTEEAVRAQGPSRFLQASAERHMMQVQQEIEEYLYNGRITDRRFNFRKEYEL